MITKQPNYFVSWSTFILILAIFFQITLVNLQVQQATKCRPGVTILQDDPPQGQLWNMKMKIWNMKIDWKYENMKIDWIKNFHTQK